MKYGGMYWNVKEILPYQRNFNFINSIRNCGKSYTLAGFFVERWIKTGEQFILLTRTIDEKNKGALQKWMDKVLQVEYPELKVIFNSDTMYLAEDKKQSTWKVMGHCRALSEAVKVKKQSFPKVKWLCLEEYMLEPKHQDLYVKGWREPDLLLNIYHTVDREQDKVCTFFLGNNTAFFNPYHLHPAFNIPPTPIGKIWKSENVLFQWYEPSEELMSKKAHNKFLRMIEGTEYGRYALEGEYIGDNESFVREKSNRAIFVFCFVFDTDTFGVWWDANNSNAYITSKYNLNRATRLVIDNITNENDVLVNKNNTLIKWLAKLYCKGCVYYENMEIKLKAENAIRRKML